MGCNLDLGGTIIDGLCIGKGYRPKRAVSSSVMVLLASCHAQPGIMAYVLKELAESRVRSSAFAGEFLQCLVHLRKSRARI